MGKAQQHFGSAHHSAMQTMLTPRPKNVDALLILTDWAEFGQLDLERLKKAMRYPIIVDGRNIFDPAVMDRLGFTYISIGRPAVYPARVSDMAATAIA
jgi:UDPglucose 6-dehydrogenase